ncbi:Putative tRNA/rRNA methyltransferase [Galdieria sulphuraria]|nr:Putative tRNA/rRNA methyltransferase [Galdieria sulphuraria]
MHFGYVDPNIPWMVALFGGLRTGNFWKSHRHRRVKSFRYSVGVVKKFCYMENTRENESFSCPEFETLNCTFQEQYLEANGKANNIGWDSPYGSVIKRTPLLDLLRQQLKKSRLEKMEQTLMQRCGSIQVLFENLHDPHNGAACIRTCEGHGIQHVHVVEAFEPFQYADGVAMSADKWMTIHRYKNLYDAVETLKQQNMVLIAACLDPDAVPIDQVDFTKYSRLCLLFGNEERGLSKGIRQLSDMKVYIPMLQGCIQPNLTQEEMQELYTKWLVRGSRRAAHLIEKHRFHFPEL